MMPLGFAACLSKNLDGENNRRTFVMMPLGFAACLSKNFFLPPYV